MTSLTDTISILRQISRGDLLVAKNGFSLTKDREKACQNLFETIMRSLSLSFLPIKPLPIKPLPIKPLPIKPLGIALSKLSDPSPIISALAPLMLEEFKPGLTAQDVGDRLFSITTKSLQLLFANRIIMRIDPYIAYCQEKLFQMAAHHPEGLFCSFADEKFEWKIDSSLIQNAKISSAMLRLFDEIELHKGSNQGFCLKDIEKIRYLSHSRHEAIQKLAPALQFMMTHIDLGYQFKSIQAYYSVAIWYIYHSTYHYREIAKACVEESVSLLELLPFKHTDKEDPSKVIPVVIDMAEEFFEKRRALYERSKAKETYQNALYRSCYAIASKEVDPIHKALEIKLRPFDPVEFRDNKLPSPEVFETISASNISRAPWGKDIRPLLFSDEIPPPTKSVIKWLAKLDASLDEAPPTPDICLFQPFVFSLPKKDEFAFEYHARVLEWFDEPLKALERPEYSHICDARIRDSILFEHQIPIGFDALLFTSFSRLNRQSEDKCSHILFGFCNKRRFILEYGFILMEEKWVCIHRWLNNDEKKINEQFCSILFHSKSYDLHFPELGASLPKVEDLSSSGRSSPTDYPIQYLDSLGVLRIRLGDIDFEFINLGKTR
jgi:hypothetical protein